MTEDRQRFIDLVTAKVVRIIEDRQASEAGPAVAAAPVIKQGQLLQFRPRSGRRPALDHDGDVVDLVVDRG